MRQDIDALFQDCIRQEAERRFSFDGDLTQPLQGFESYVFDCHGPEQSFIMKITHTLRRTFDQIMGELEFVNYLADRGIVVPRAIRSANGHLVERIDAEHGQFLAYAYVKANGQHLGKLQLTPEVIRKWGALIGRMHALTKDFEPSIPSYRRWHWHEDDYAQFESYIPATETGVLEKAHHLYQRLHALPKSRDTYGLIHMDLHLWNFFYHSGDIIPFDFDDCLYSWFIADIAMALYYVTHEEAAVDGRSEVEWWPGSLNLSRGRLVAMFMDNFLSGYGEENTLSLVWLRHIPEFLRLRLLDLYIGKLMSWGTTGLSKPQLQNLKRHREAIEDDGWIDMGFEAFC